VHVYSRVTIVMSSVFIFETLAVLGFWCICLLRPLLSAAVDCAPAPHVFFSQLPLLQLQPIFASTFFVLPFLLLLSDIIQCGGYLRSLVLQDDSWPLLASDFSLGASLHWLLGCVFLCRAMWPCVWVCCSLWMGVIRGLR
jgi:hypothetical protein